MKLDNVYYLDSTNQNVNGIFTDDGDDKVGTLVGTAAAKTDAEMKADAFVTLLGNAFEKDAENHKLRLSGILDRSEVPQEKRHLYTPGLRLARQRS